MLLLYSKAIKQHDFSIGTVGRVAHSFQRDLIFSGIGFFRAPFLKGLAREVVAVGSSSGNSVIGRWLSNTTKSTFKLFSAVSYPVLMGLLIFELCLPLHLQADPPKAGNPAEDSNSQEDGAPPAGNLDYSSVQFGSNQALPGQKLRRLPEEELASVSPAVAEFAAQAQRAHDTNAPFFLDEWRRNTGFLLKHKYYKTESAAPLDISQLQLGVSSTAIQEGVVQYALQVKAEGSKLQFSLKDGEEIHEMDFKKFESDTATVLDYDWDDEWVYVLLSNGELYAADVDALRTSMFRSAFPFYTLGNVNKSVTDGPAITKIRILQRRVDPADRTKAAQMARLDLNPKTAENIRKNASPELVVRLKENLEMIRPFDVHPALAAKLPKAENGEPLIGSANLGLFYEAGGTEVLREIEPVAKVAAKVGLQEPFVEALQHFADPNTKDSVRELQGITEDALKEIAEILNDEKRLAEFENSGLRQALSALDKRTLNATREHVSKLAKALLEAAENKTEDALRDRFTPTQLKADYQYFEDLVAEAEKSLSAKPVSILGKTTAAVGAWTKKRWENFHPIRRMQAVGSMLKKPLFYSGAALASAATLDVYFNGNTQLTVETLMGMWSLAANEWVPAVQQTALKTMPVLADGKYMTNMALFSWPGRVALMLSPIVLAGIASRFSQHSPSKLMVIKGIKWAFSWAMMPPVRAGLSLPFYRRLDVLNAMKRGHLPVSLLLPRFSEEARVASRARAESSIQRKERLGFLARATALRIAAERHARNPYDLLADIASDPNSKPDRDKIAGITTALTELISSDMGQATAAALKSDGEVFVRALGKYNDIAMRTAAISIKPRPGSLALLKFAVLPKMISAAANFGEATFEPVANPVPADGAVKYVVNGFFMDGGFALAQTSLVGGFANPGQPENLSYQPDGLLNTNTGVWVEGSEQIGLHLGLVAALTAATWSDPDQKRAVLKRYAPAIEMDEEREVGQRGKLKEAGKMLLNFFDWRNNNWADLFGKRSWKQCVTLFQGFFIIGMLIRLMEGVIDGHLGILPGNSMVELVRNIWGGDYQTFLANISKVLDPAAVSAWKQAWGHYLVKAVDGQAFFLFLAPFTYRYQWAIHQAVVNGMENELAALGEKYQTLYTTFAQALKRGDLDQAENTMVDLIKLYDEEHRDIPDEIRVAIQRQPGEDRLQWMTRALKAQQEFSAVPEKINAFVNRAVFLVFSFTTTFLAGFLMIASLKQGRSILGDGTAPYGFDMNHWNLFAGPSAADGAHALMIKSLILINAVWLGGLLYKVAWDTGRLGLNAAHRAVRGRTETKEERTSMRQGNDVTVPADAHKAHLVSRWKQSVGEVLSFFGVGSSAEAKAKKKLGAVNAEVKSCKELLASSTHVGMPQLKQVEQTAEEELRLAVGK